VRVLRIRTNLVLVVASALGYYFFAGVATFGFSYLHSEFGISETTAPVIVLLLGGAAAAGVVTGGSVADRLRRRYRSGRVIAVLVAFGAAVVLLVPALAVSDLPISLPLLVAGAAMLGAANPPLDAARIDIVPRRLLGRAESIRTMLSSGVDVSAPAAFGFLGGSLGLSTTFLLMTIPLGLALGLGVIALRTYPADAAAAIESRPDDRMSPRQVSSRRESP
jgi:predicted MFS family arabinose efflux permease